MDEQQPINYYDLELKKKNKRAIWVIILSSILLFILSVVISIYYLFTRVINYQTITPPFYLTLSADMILQLIILVGMIYLLNNHRKMSTHTKKSLAVRVALYSITLIALFLFSYTGVFSGDNVYNEYLEVKYYDEVYVAQINELNILEMNTDNSLKSFLEGGNETLTTQSIAGVLSNLAEMNASYNLIKSKMEVFIADEKLSVYSIDRLLKPRLEILGDKIEFVIFEIGGMKRIQQNMLLNDVQNPSSEESQDVFAKEKELLDKVKFLNIKSSS